MPTEPAPLRPFEKDLVVESFELFDVPPRWLFLKVTTKGGLVGWGEPIVEGRSGAVRAAVEELGEYVIGRPANRIEDIWQVLYRGGFYRGGPVLMSAIAGIDQALWDIKGKALDAPVYELLGGAVRGSIAAYGWIGGDSPDGVAEAAQHRVKQGFGAVKMNASGRMAWIDSPQRIEEIAQRMRSVREAVGPDIGIGVDFHGRIHRGLARRAIEALEPYAPMFVEEPVAPGHEDLLAGLAAGLRTPLATGERLYSRWDFKNVLPHIDVAQPDVSHAGGISETRRIASMAEAYDVALAPHCPLGPLALAASLHVDFASANAFIQETSLGMHYHDQHGVELLDYVANPEVFAVREGKISLPERPGLGVEIDEDIVREEAGRYTTGGSGWRNPVWRLGDGSFAEW